MYRSGYQGDSSLNSSSMLTHLPYLENEDIFPSLHSYFRSCVIHDLYCKYPLPFFFPPFYPFFLLPPLIFLV